MTIQANQGFGVSVFGATGSGSGGTTSPGGSSLQIQYNAAGSFGGMAGTSWDNTNRSLTLTGATVTTSNPVLNLSQTWNAGAVTFKGWVLNVTDTASASASLLMDLQVGGSSKFSVDKSGNATGVSYYINGSTLQIKNLSGGIGFIDTSGNAAYVGFGTFGAKTIGLGTDVTSPDVKLTRAAAASLQLGAADAAAPVAQTLGVQSVVAGTSNTAGVNFTIKGSAGTGTGAGGDVLFQTAAAGGSGTAQNSFTTRLRVSGTNAGIEVFNHVYGPSGQTLYIGSNGYVFGGQMQVNGSTFKVQMASNVAFGWSADTTSYGTFDLILARAAAATLQLGAADTTGTTAPTAQTLRVQSWASSTSNNQAAGANFTIQGAAGTGTGAGGSIIFQVAPASGVSGNTKNAYATALTIAANSNITAGTGYAFTATYVNATNNLAVTNNTGYVSLGASADVQLYRDAANTLALRNGTSAQTFNIYNTYTSGTDYERFTINAQSGAAVLIGTNKGSGGGTARNLELQRDATTQITLGNGETVVGAGNQPLVTIGHSTANTSARIGFNGGVQLVNSTVGSVSSLRLTNGALADFGALQFGGTTSSFPALKRVSANLQVIAADNSGSAGFIVGNQALATNATDGFLYIPTCAGTPTGTPTVQTGTAPLVVDSTNNKLYVYVGGAWVAMN